MISCCSVFDSKLQSGSQFTKERIYLLEQFFFFNCSMGELLVVKTCECLILCKPYLFPLLTFSRCSFFTDTGRFRFPRNIYLCWCHEFRIYLHNMWLSLKRACISLYFYQVLIVIKRNQNNRALL